MAVAVALLASGAAAGFDPPPLPAATPRAEATAELKNLSMDEIRRRLAALEAEARAALADEDYEREARLRREMAPLDEEIARRAREAIPTPPPSFRVPRR
ncbi:MAG TPA: hypothetical protein VIG69_09880 [Candidatus Methylomirabilis sp.]|jgi:hypothetical protein